MTIEFDESIRGLWYCVLVPDKQDFLLSLSHKDEGHYAIIYRFRYYNSADPFDEEDKKNWYSVKVTDENEKELVDGIRTLLNQLLSFTNDDICYTEMLRGDQSLDEFMDEFIKQDFVHTQRCH
jgi:hypothetical protein